MCVVPRRRRRDRRDPGDQNGQAGEDGGQVADPRFRDEFVRISVIVKMIDKGTGGIVFFVHGFDRSERGTDGSAGFNADNVE